MSNFSLVYSKFQCWLSCHWESLECLKWTADMNYWMLNAHLLGFLEAHSVWMPGLKIHRRKPTFTQSDPEMKSFWKSTTTKAVFKLFIVCRILRCTSSLCVGSFISWNYNFWSYGIYSQFEPFFHFSLFFQIMVYRSWNDEPQQKTENMSNCYTEHVRC